MTIINKWRPRSAASAIQTMNDAKDAQALTITPTDYDWARPFDLHVFRNQPNEVELEDEIAFHMDAYDGEWMQVSFPWVVAHVDFIHQVITY